MTNALFQSYRAGLEEELRAVVGNSDLPLYHMIRYHLGWSDEAGKPRGSMTGKALRPLLCLLACEAVGGPWRRALPAAASLELLHNFSLVHDDIEDRGQERRGSPAVWRVWGEPQAINAGDALLALSRLALLRLKAPAEKVLRAAHLLDDACLNLCEGQYLDLSYERRLDIGVEIYLEMIGLKTAPLLESSLKLGALLGTDDEELIQRFGLFGRKLGLAFQIRDDVLGVWGEEKATGKSPVDIEKRKKTLPVLYGLEKAQGEEKEKLLRLYDKESLGPQEVSKVLRLLDSLGAQAYAQGMAERYYGEAIAELEAAGLPPSRQKALKEAALLLVKREH